MLQNTCTPYLKKLTEMLWLLYDNILNSAKILTVQSIENFNSNLVISISSDCLAAVRLTITMGVVPDFLHNEGDLIQITKLLSRLHLSAASWIFFSFFTNFSLSANYMQKS